MLTRLNKHRPEFSLLNRTESCCIVSSINRWHIPRSAPKRPTSKVNDVIMTSNEIPDDLNTSIRIKVGNKAALKLSNIFSPQNLVFQSVDGWIRRLDFLTVEQLGPASLWPPDRTAFQLSWRSIARSPKKCNRSKKNVFFANFAGSCNSSIKTSMMMRGRKGQNTEVRKKKTWVWLDLTFGLTELALM